MLERAQQLLERAEVARRRDERRALSKEKRKIKREREKQARAQLGIGIATQLAGFSYSQKAMKNAMEAFVSRHKIAPAGPPVEPDPEALNVDSNQQIEQPSPKDCADTGATVSQPQPNDTTSNHLPQAEAPAPDPAPNPQMDKDDFDSLLLDDDIFSIPWSDMSFPPDDGLDSGAVTSAESQVDSQSRVPCGNGTPGVKPSSNGPHSLRTQGNSCHSGIATSGTTGSVDKTAPCAERTTDLQVIPESLVKEKTLDPSISFDDSFDLQLLQPWMNVLPSNQAASANTATASLKKPRADDCRSGSHSRDFTADRNESPQQRFGLIPDSDHTVTPDSGRNRQDAPGHCRTPVDDPTSLDLDSVMLLWFESTSQIERELAGLSSPVFPFPSRQAQPVDPAASEGDPESRTNIPQEQVPGGNNEDPGRDRAISDVQRNVGLGLDSDGLPSVSSSFPFSLGDLQSPLRTRAGRCNHIPPGSVAEADATKSPTAVMTPSRGASKPENAQSTATTNGQSRTDSLMPPPPSVGAIMSPSGAQVRTGPEPLVEQATTLFDDLNGFASSDDEFGFSSSELRAIVSISDEMTNSKRTRSEGPTVAEDNSGCVDGRDTGVNVGSVSDQTRAPIACASVSFPAPPPHPASRVEFELSTQIVREIFDSDDDDDF